MVDKSAIRTFAVESRRQMIESVKYQASLIGITADGISEPISKAEGMETYDYGAGTYSIYDNDIEKRESLVKEIQNKGYDNVVEEVSYTWFNRIIAIRFMEVNDYLPTRTRVLSSEIRDKTEPDIITEALELDLEYSAEDKESIFKLKDENKLDDLFQFLFIKQCKKLNEILPGLFQQTDDWMELLLNISFTDESSIIRKLIEDIPEDDFSNQVEIIGWLYQFYNTELKEENGNKYHKVPKEAVPSITQLFTPKWIVKYLVENSLGRLWLEGHPNLDFENKLKYFVEDCEQDEDINFKLVEIKEDAKKLRPQDIKLIDPCMGSGHILIYVFDLLMEIYISEGYTKNDAVVSILKNNIYGLDIDVRAYQLAYFSVMMKARSYNRSLFSINNLNPHLYFIPESNNVSDELISLLSEKDSETNEIIRYVKELFIDAKEYGSVLNVKKLGYSDVKNIILQKHINDYSNLKFLEFKNQLNTLISILDVADVLSNKYDVAITNPPYFSAKRMDNKLKKFLKKNYPLSKGDMCTVFIEKCQDLLRTNGFSALITQHSFMFLSTFEKLRIKLIDTNFVNLVHFGPRAFEEIKGEKVQTVAFISRNSSFKNYNTVCHRLVEYNKPDLKESEFLNGSNKIIFKMESIKSIPSNPMAYWMNNNLINAFNIAKRVDDFADAKIGLQTGDTNRFLRFWFEIDFMKFKMNPIVNPSDVKWFPYNKGGPFRKWYGNQEYVVDWENNGFNIKNDKLDKLSKGLIQKKNSGCWNEEYYFKESLGWSLVSSKVGFRYYSNDFMFDISGCSLFSENKNINYIFGFLNSNISQYLLDSITPSLGYSTGYVSSLPIIIDELRSDEIENIVLDNVSCCKLDWNDYELSWGFLNHPLVRFDETLIEKSFQKWNDYKTNLFNRVKHNEIKLNKLFCEIYEVDMDCHVEDKYISVSKSNYEKDIKSFISYSVGCMFGRYSLDNNGIIHAGGEFNLDNYNMFIPDDDNIIPVLDTEYFDDDIVGRFVEFVKVCFGEKTLEENLDFIAGALNKKGKTSREIIRNYFLKDFFKDHSQAYQKCPIYWMFNSGKQNAFNCLICIHRYEPDIIARVRTDYLHKTQKAIEQNLAHCENIISNSSNKSEVSKATKDKNKYIKQLDEIKNYDEALGHMANQHVEIDLDDGVKVNYAKFQNIEISKEGEKTKKINLLKKI